MNFLLIAQLVCQNFRFRLILWACLNKAIKWYSMKIWTSKFGFTIFIYSYKVQQVGLYKVQQVRIYKVSFFGIWKWVFIRSPGRFVQDLITSTPLIHHKNSFLKKYHD